MERIVDLTYPIHEGMTTFPVHWHPVVEIAVMGRHGIENRETRKVLLGTHTGTHCDAPRHFVPGGASLDEIPLSTFIGPAVVLDLSGSERLREVSVGDLERKLGARRPERLVLRYDWSRHWGTMEFYRGNPHLAVAAAQWLVGRGVRLLAMDTPMPDNPAHGRDSDCDSPVHKVLLGAGVILVEYLCNLDQLSRDEVDLVVLPLKVAGADGAPVRCVAIERS